MAKDFAKNKCFIKTEKGYKEITYEELLHIEEADPSYKDRKFLVLHGMLVEVSLEDYQAFYKEYNRQRYTQRLSMENGDISYDMLTNEDFNGADFLMDKSDTVELVEKRMQAEQLRTILALLPKEDIELIEALFYKGMTERDMAGKYQISQAAVHKRKQRILEKLKKLLKNF
ncbi:MAG: hypothetical protein KHX38_05415 [Ruminococcus sp.]|nr:hypothetical protein [Ruminococcus sp.]MBS5452945.1 hypothetical protein [Ruminococcus sp.]